MKKKKRESNEQSPGLYYQKNPTKNTKSSKVPNRMFCFWNMTVKMARKLQMFYYVFMLFT